MKSKKAQFDTGFIVALIILVIFAIAIIAVILSPNGQWIRTSMANALGTLGK